MKKEIHKLNVIYFYDKGYYIAYLPHFHIIISEYKKRRVRKEFEMIKDYTINHCKEIDKSELIMGDIIATEFRGELHVAIWYEFGKVIEVFKEHTLQIGRVNKFKDYKCFRVIK